MLIRSTWTLTVPKATTLPRSFGLELIKDLTQSMGGSLGNDPIPTTGYSGIVGNVTLSPDFFTFHPGEFYQLSLCGLQEQASKVIVALDFSASLQLCGAEFDIVDRQDETTSYESLYTNLVANEPEPTRRFNLRFTTPTAFAQKHLQLPLPVPTLMFRSWLERWNHFAPVYLGGDELISYLSEAVALNRHRIQTRSFRIHKGTVGGFTGEVSLQVLHRADPLLANVANLLVHYSQFAGTGMKTRLGMGQTTLIQQT